VITGLAAYDAFPPLTANEAGAQALAPPTPHTDGFGTLALAPYGRPFPATAGEVGAATVSGPFTVRAKVAVFDVPTGTEAFAASAAVMLRFGVAGNGELAVTEAEEQLYVVPLSAHVHVPGAETTVAFVA
jgi:hypothetical protein